MWVAWRGGLGMNRDCYHRSAPLQAMPKLISIEGPICGVWLVAEKSCFNPFSVHWMKNQTEKASLRACAGAVGGGVVVRHR